MRSHEASWQLTPGRLVIGGLILLTLLVSGRCAISCMYSKAEVRTARERVRDTFEALKPGGNFEKAIALWYQGAHRVSGGQEVFNTAAEQLSTWCKDHKLEAISEFELGVGRELAEKGRFGESVVEIGGTVNGRPFRLRVQRGQPLVWLD
jgi:hypothetical protein